MAFPYMWVGGDRELNRNEFEWRQFEGRNVRGKYFCWMSTIFFFGVGTTQVGKRQRDARGGGPTSQMALYWLQEWIGMG